MGDFNQAKYIQEYQKEKYDRCIFNVPKGHKAEITNFYKICGFTSLNSYVNTLIQNDMDIVTKRMKSLSNDEQFLINAFRYANDEQKQRLINLASEIESNLSRADKEKIYNLRKKSIEIEVEKEWMEDFQQQKLPGYHIE